MKPLADLFNSFFCSIPFIQRLALRGQAQLESRVTIKGPLSNLVLGTNIKIQSNTVLHLGGMSWCDKKGHLSIGDNAVISPNCVFYACGPGGIRIGKNFDCAPGVCIFASSTDYKKGPGHYRFAPVVIGDNVTIFANAVISPGVTIGNHAVIAACSVVTKDIPAGSFAGGAPARIIRMSVNT